MIDPGQLDTRLVVEAPVESGDGQGGVVRSYAAVATAWAALQPGGARPDAQADADGASVRLRITLRNALPLTLRHRLVDGGRVYRITALHESADRRYLVIDADWRID